MPTPPVNLGYDKPTEASVDAVNIWMRSRPWYQELMAGWGQDPGHPTLTKSQSQQVLRAAQSEGVVVDEGDMEVDDHGNFNPKGHKLRNTLIVAGIAGATLATLGAAGAFAGGAATASGVPGIGITSSPLLAGSAAANSATALTAAATGASAAGAAGAAGIAGGTAARGAVGAAGATGKVSDLLGAVGAGIGSATSAAGEDRRAQENAALTANGQNIAGLSAMERMLLERAAAERTERGDALRDVYRGSYVANPHVSPFNPSGPRAYSDEYRGAVSTLAGRGATRLAAAPAYDTTTMGPVPRYTPLDIKDVQGATGTRKGALERIGDWAAPGLTLTGRVIRLLGR